MPTYERAPGRRHHGRCAGACVSHHSLSLSVFIFQFTLSADLGPPHTAPTNYHALHRPAPGLGPTKTAVKITEKLNHLKEERADVTNSLEVRLLSYMSHVCQNLKEERSYVTNSLEVGLLSYSSRVCQNLKEERAYVTKSLEVRLLSYMSHVCQNLKEERAYVTNLLEDHLFSYLKRV
ncbi:hypothetical protein ACJJTC_006444 [Scirpophaga incertulas]